MSKGLKQAIRKDLVRIQLEYTEDTEIRKSKSVFAFHPIIFYRGIISGEKLQIYQRETVEVAGPRGFRAVFVPLAPRFPKIER